MNKGEVITMAGLNITALQGEAFALVQEMATNGSAPEQITPSQMAFATICVMEALLRERR